MSKKPCNWIIATKLLLQSIRRNKQALWQCLSTSLLQLRYHYCQRRKVRLRGRRSPSLKVWQTLFLCATT